MGICRLAEGQVDEAIRIHELVQSRIAVQPHWFQGRELVEALAIRLALREGRDEAAHLFKAAVDLAETQDVYGAILLTADVGQIVREVAPEAVEEAVARYGGRAEVLGNPRLRDQFGVLMLDNGGKTVDRV